MSAADAARYAALVKSWPARPPRWLLLTMFGVAVLNFNLTLCSSRPRHDLMDTVVEGFYLAATLLWVVSNFVSFRKTVEALDGATLVFGDDGISSERLQALLPWRAIGWARDLGEAIAIFPLKRPAIVIPKESLADGGAALWSFLEQHLIGKRMLRRSPSTTIVNTVNAGATAF